MRRLVLVAALAACNAFELPAPPDRDAKPIANAGTGSTFEVGESITLDGSASYDPDGTIASYRWYGISVPMGSTARPADVNASVTTYVPDVFGAYHLELVVEDDGGNSDRSELFFDVGQVTGISAGPDASVPWLGTAHITGTITGGAGSPTWSLDSKPAGSVATLAGGALTPSFVADVPGDYVLTLTVRAGQNTFTDSVTITATATGLPLGSGTYAYKYSTALDRLLMLRSGSTVKLAIIDPITGVETTIDSGLPLASTMALDPAGDRVAIAGDRKVVLVRLSPPQLLDVYDIPIFPSTIVFGSDNRVHCFEGGPAGQTMPLPMLVSLDLATRAASVMTGPVTRPNTATSKDGRRLFIDSDNTSDLFIYDLTTTPITMTTHASNLAAGPPLHADELGRWVSVREGTIYDVTTSTPTLKSSLSLSTELLVSLAQSAARNELAVGTSNTGPSHLILYNNTTFMRGLRVAVPEINGMSTSAGFVAYDSSSTHLFVVARTSFNGAVLHVVPL